MLQKKLWLCPNRLRLSKEKEISMLLPFFFFISFPGRSPTGHSDMNELIFTASAERAKQVITCSTGPDQVHVLYQFKVGGS
jgi:hypothetical protein